jgi:transposase
MDTSTRKKKKNGEDKKRPGPKTGQQRVEQHGFKSRGHGKNTSLTIGQKLQVIEKMEQEGWTQQRAAEHFSKEWKLKIKQANISRWLKKKEKWMEEIDEMVE